MCQNRLDTTHSILVLIDTWWNVNLLISNTNKTIVKSFNRYMVECEYTYEHIQGYLLFGFNRYMVECEYQKQ